MPSKFSSQSVLAGIVDKTLYVRPNEAPNEASDEGLWSGRHASYSGIKYYHAAGLRVVVLTGIITLKKQPTPAHYSPSAIRMQNGPSHRTR